MNIGRNIMDDVDIKTIEIICTKMKIKYDEMDVAFGDKIAGTNIYVPINLTSILTELYTFKESLINVEGFEIHVAISILNIFAHYKHFFQIKNASHVIVLGYVRDNWVYNKYKDVLDQVVDYCEFFPNIYMMAKIMCDNRLYMHLVASAISYMKSISPNIHQSSIFVVSNTVIDRQLMCVFPTKDAYTIFKNYARKAEIIEKTSYMRGLFNKPQFYDESPYKSQLEQMNVLLGVYFGKFKTIAKRLNKDAKIEYAHNKTNDKMNILSEFLNKVYDQNSTNSVSVQFIEYLVQSNELTVPKPLYSFESMYDYRCQRVSVLHNIVIPILNSWKKKIKDYNLARESEKYKTLISHQLFSNWLC